MQIEKAVAYVRKFGSPLHQLRLTCILGEPFSLTEAEDVLAPYQFPDGSWDYSSAEEESTRIGSLGGTIHCLRWIREFGLARSEQMLHTLKFLASIQEKDGSFYETKAKIAHSPQEWLQKERLIDQFYFTAAVPMRLFSLGHTYKDHPLITPAREWLSHFWSNWRIVTGTWYNLWALLCISMDFTVDLALYDTCSAQALAWLPHLEAQPLTWLLDALQGAGFTGEEPLIKEGVARLRTLQRGDGTWHSPHKSRVEVMVTALRLLHDYESL